MKTFTVVHKSECELCGNRSIKNIYVVQSENNISGIRNLQTDVKEIKNLIKLHNIDILYPQSVFLISETKIY